jgi:hypothetical protein
MVLASRALLYESSQLSSGVDMTGLLSRENWNGVGLRKHRRFILLIYAGQRVTTPERSRIGFVGS